jgi:hypothetical protein
MLQSFLEGGTKKKRGRVWKGLERKREGGAKDQI